MRKLFARIVQAITGGGDDNGGRPMESTTTATVREPVFDQFFRALGIIGIPLDEVERESQSRVAEGLPPGRVKLVGPQNIPTLVMYSSPLEASLDFRCETRERELANAESLYEANRDDIAGGWGDEVSHSRAKANRDCLRANCATLQRLRPLIEYVGITTQLRDARHELENLQPGYVAPTYGAINVEMPRGVSQHPMRDATEPHDVARAAAARMAARVNTAAHAPTNHSMVQAHIYTLEGRLARWVDANEMLAAMLRADRERGA